MNKTVCEFGLGENTIRSFVKSINSVVDDEGRLPYGLGPRRNLFKNRVGKYSQIDEKLFTYVCRKRSLKKIVTRRELGKKARRFAEDDGVNDFEASGGYISKFLQRFS